MKKNMGGEAGVKAASFGGLRRVKKNGPSDAQKLAKLQGKTKRGAAVALKVRQEYRANKKYTKEDVMNIINKINNGELTKKEMNKMSKSGLWLMKYPVPAKTIYHWMGKDAGESEPRWVRANLATAEALPRTGRECVLGRADHVLMCVIAIAEKGNMPYQHNAIKNIARTMLVKLGAMDPRTKKPYTELSEMTGWFRSFVERCEKKGIYIKARDGHTKSTQRVRTGRVEVIEHYRDKVRHAVALFYPSRFHCAPSSFIRKTGIVFDGNLFRWCKLERPRLNKRSAKPPLLRARSA